MFGRLDLFREASVIVPVPLAYAPVRKGPFVAMPPPPPPSPLPVYVLAAERKPEEFDKLIAGVFRQGDTGSLQLESDPFLA